MNQPFSQEVTLSAHWANGTSPYSQEGDIIGIDSPEKVDVKVNGVGKFKAKMGEIDGKVCLRVLG